MTTDLIFGAAQAATDIALAGIESGRDAGRRESAAKIAELSDGLAGLYGLLQLLSGRDDVPAFMRDCEWESNHRAVEARRLLADHEQHAVKVAA